jgi:uncharacterized protein with GYD domain
MPHYMIQASYTSEAWAIQLQQPGNRLEVVKPVIEKLGGRIEAVYFAFGDYDVVLILEFPGDIDAWAFEVAVMAGGAAKDVKMTQLLTVEEGVEVMKQAATSGYLPPGS